MRRKFWRMSDTIIAITDSPEGDERAREAGYRRLRLAEMTSEQRMCLRSYDQNDPTYFPAKYLG